MMPLLLVFLFTLRVTGQQTGYFFTLSGKVTDAETCSSIFLANVFLANTTLGSATDKSGQYTIERVPPGRHTVVISMMGYEIVRQNITVSPEGPYIYNFSLTPKPIMGETITISGDGKRAKQWRQQLKRFRQLFLGISDHAKTCKITQPEYLNFKNDDRGGFIAETERPIHILNEALGYEILYYLDHFAYTNDQHLSYNGVAKYIEMKSDDSAQRAEWRTARERAYRGSLQHFYRAVAGCRAKAEGFTVGEITNSLITGKEQLAPPLDPDTLSHAARHYYEAMLHLPKRLYIIYKKAQSPKWYKRAIGREFNHDTFLNSRLDVLSTPLLINRGGKPLSPLTTLADGYWSFLRMADQLPVNYTPLTDDPPGEDIVWRPVHGPSQSLLNDNTPMGNLETALRLAENDSTYLATQCLKTALLTNKQPVIERVLHIIQDLISDAHAQNYRHSEHPGQALWQLWQSWKISPAIPENHRFREHIQRLSHARLYYPDKTSRGYDDRGSLYIRYGAPDQIITMMADPPLYANEAWAYHWEDDPVIFNVINRGSGFQITTSTETALALNAFGEELRPYYAARAVLHPSYGQIADALATYGGKRDSIDIWSRLRPIIEDVEWSSQRAPRTRSSLSLSRSIEGQLSTARFLRGGKTVLEAYYALPFSQLSPKDIDGHPVINLRLSYCITDKNHGTRTQHDYCGQMPFDIDNLVQDLDYQSQVNITLPEGPALYTLALTDINSQGVFERDLTTRTFQLKNTTLALSDIQLATSIEPAPQKIPAQLKPYFKKNLIVRPYAYDSLHPDRAIYLYFEAYNLSLNKEGHSKFEIGYSLTTPQSFWSRINIFNRNKAKAEATFNRARNTQNSALYFAVDLSQLKAGKYHLKVRVTDLLNNTTAVSKKKINILKR